MDAADHKHISADTVIQLQYQARKKSLVFAYLIWFFLMPTSLHRFYLQPWTNALGQLALFVLGITITFFTGEDKDIVGLILLSIWGIWVLTDAFRIPGMVQKYNADLISELAGLGGEESLPPIQENMPRWAKAWIEDKSKGRKSTSPGEETPSSDSETR